jgi:hypothetical protein|tara:strand:- start:878 stop:1030 length:153 start_codon:yes stop_codon:yes gene_type:complete
MIKFVKFWEGTKNPVTLWEQDEAKTSEQKKIRNDQEKKLRQRLNNNKLNK